MNVYASVDKLIIMPQSGTGGRYLPTPLFGGRV